MASSGTLLFIFTVLCINVVKSGEFVKVECKTPNVGHYGQQSLLECVIKTAEVAQDATIRLVTWKKLTSPEDKDGFPLVVFAKDKLNKTSGYRFADPSWDKKNMNVSLLITNTSVADDGYYKCTVITDRGDSSMLNTLKVQAKYSISTIYSIPAKIVPNKDSTLICKSREGYPKGTLRWFDEENHEWTKSSEMEVTQSNDGLFQLTSRLSLLRGSTFLKYTCGVFNASGEKEDEFTFEMPAPPSEVLGPGSPETSKIAAPLVVIGSLIIGLLCALLLYRRRSQKTRKNSTAPLMDGHDLVSTAEHNLEHAGYKLPEDEPINQDQS